MHSFNNKKLFSSLLVFAGIIFFVSYFSILHRGDNEIQELSEQTHRVTIASVAELSAKRDPLQLIGNVQSESEVTIRTEAQGIITHVYVSENQFVQAGTVFAEIENSVQQAQVRQAKGSVASAEAGISIFDIQIENAEDVLHEALQSAVHSLHTTFENTSDAIRGNIDQMFSDPLSASPQLNFNTSYQLKTDIEWGRFVVEESLKEWEISLDGISSASDLEYYLDDAETRLVQIRDFLDMVTNAVNGLTPYVGLSETTINAWRGATLSARTTVGGSITGISAIRDSLHNKKSTLSVLQKQGGSLETNAQGVATLSQAQGLLDAAQANLEKTIIRTPISGTVNNLLIERGDFVSMSQDIGMVSNNANLEIITYITEDDRWDVSVGTPVLIDGVLGGVVSEIAPALDSRTKKIALTISITENSSSLINGESVTLAVERTSKSPATQDVLVPVTALKIGPNDVSIFTLDGSRLVALPISIGSIVGSSVIVRHGLTPDMEIVVDARGLQEGEEVTVN